MALLPCISVPHWSNLHSRSLWSLTKRRTIRSIKMMDNRLERIPSVTCSNVHSRKNIRHGRSTNSLRLGRRIWQQTITTPARRLEGNLSAWLWSVSFVRERRSWLLHRSSPPVRERVCIFPALLTCFSGATVKEKVKACCVWRPNGQRVTTRDWKHLFIRNLRQSNEKFDVPSCSRSVLPEDNLGIWSHPSDCQDDC